MRALRLFQTLLTSAAAVATLATLASGQTITASRQAAPRGPAGLVGAEISIVEPRGEFATHVKGSVGYALHGIFVDRQAAFGIGADFRSVSYDSRDLNDTTTVNNMMRTFTVGSRYMLPIPFVRPYVGAAIGGAYFATETNVKKWEYDEEEREWSRVSSLEDVKNPRMTYTMSRSAGVHIDVYEDRSGKNKKPFKVTLDAGVSDHFGGRTSYLTNGRGPRVRTSTDHRVWRIGVSVWNR